MILLCLYNYSLDSVLKSNSFNVLKDSYFLYKLIEVHLYAFVLIPALVLSIDNFYTPPTKFNSVVQYGKQIYCLCKSKKSLSSLYKITFLSHYHLCRSFSLSVWIHLSWQGDYQNYTESCRWSFGIILNILEKRY